jgi:hypothetical protein
VATAEYRERIRRQGGLTDRDYARQLALADGGTSNPLAAPAVVDLPESRPAGTIHRLADLLRGKEPPPDSGATLAFDGEETQPVWPRNPVPVPEGRRPQRAPRGRPPGSDEITPLLATGLMLLTGFLVGEWAAPTPDESNAIAVPLSNILARRIDLAARLGRDASDTIALSVALMVYLYRIGPIAFERARGSLGRERLDRSGEPADTPAYAEGPRDVAADAAHRVDPSLGSPGSPLAAVARARQAGLDYLDRDFGYLPNGGAAVGARG